MDAPALAPRLIPETCLEVFRTEYLKPWKEGTDASVPLFLVPSPEVYLKRIIAQHGTSLFQISKCYRNSESVGRIHSPEFTMLEYYTIHAGYRESLDITEALITYLLDTLFTPQNEPLGLRPPFIRMTMDEAFRAFAGFSLAECPEPADLAHHAQRLGLNDEHNFSQWSWDDLYEIILVHSVEPALPRDRPVALLDYPAAVPCLAAGTTQKVTRADGRSVEWKTKERWELYMRGVEIANCYTEERNEKEITQYIQAEDSLKQKEARIPHPPVTNFSSVCAHMPPCSGSALGLDRLIMLLADKSSIDSILPFPLTDAI